MGRLIRLWCAFSVMLLLAAGSACGPVESIAVIYDAEAAVAAARAEQANIWAPYEYFMAVELLHKASEEMGYSQYENAIEYANGSKTTLGARDYAALALKKSRLRKMQQ